MANRAFRKPRARTLAPARGRILEIGFGTGMNLKHYPASVTRIEAIDPDLDLDRFSGPRIASSRIDVDFHHLDAEHLPFEPESFDTVVSTLTLCSIPDVVHALGEIRRVLKPGGQFLFLEHGRARAGSEARPLAGAADAVLEAARRRLSPRPARARARSERRPRARSRAELLRRRHPAPLRLPDRGRRAETLRPAARPAAARRRIRTIRRSRSRSRIPLPYTAVDGLPIPCPAHREGRGAKE